MHTKAKRPVEGAPALASEHTELCDNLKQLRVHLDVLQDVAQARPRQPRRYEAVYRHLEKLESALSCPPSGSRNQEPFPTPQKESLS